MHIADQPIRRPGPVQDVHDGWAEQIRERRLDKGLKLREFAELCGVTEATMSRIENGKLAPNDGLKWKIAGVFGVRMDRMWAWPTIVPPQPDLVREAS